MPHAWVCARPCSAEYVVVSSASRLASSKFSRSISKVDSQLKTQAVLSGCFSSFAVARASFIMRLAVSGNPKAHLAQAMVESPMLFGSMPNRAGLVPLHVKVVSRNGLLFKLAGADEIADKHFREAERIDGLDHQRFVLELVRDVHQAFGEFDAFRVLRADHVNGAIP